MDNDRPILCLEHCKNCKIFGFNIPKICSYCGTQLETADLIIPPFRIPNPFRDAAKTPLPCAILLKPTIGDFLTDYKKADNLHIGVTSSTGLVYEFDSRGLQIDNGKGWSRCLTIRDLSMGYRSQGFGFKATWEQYWDFTLNIVAGQNNWAKDQYNDVTHNCYTFVLMFLRALQIEGLSDFAKDRASFCREFILPKTSGAAKYITLYRKLVSEL